MIMILIGDRYCKIRATKLSAVRVILLVDVHPKKIASVWKGLRNSAKFSVNVRLRQLYCMQY